MVARARCTERLGAVLLQVSIGQYLGQSSERLLEGLGLEFGLVLKGKVRAERV